MPEIKLEKNIEVQVLIIGAGISGCTVSRELSRYNLKIALVDKEKDVGWGTTKANSGIIHPGYAGEERTLRFKYCHSGNLLFRKNAEELNIKIKNTGSLLNAVNKKELVLLEQERIKGIGNGLTGLKIITDFDNLRIFEPNISPRVHAALYSKETCIVSPYEATMAVYENARTNGVNFFFNCEVSAIIYCDLDKKFTVKTKNGISFKTEYIINAAGIYADNIAGLICDDSFKITPKKGQYLLFDSSAAGAVRMVNFRLSNNKTKGVLVSPTISGNFFIGPTYNNSSKEDLNLTYFGINELKRKAEGFFINLPYDKVITAFAGLRAVSDSNDFIIKISKTNKRFLHVAGTQSPGLTCSFKIAEVTADIFKEMFEGKNSSKARKIIL